jgi:hypothetical protein
MLWSNKAGKVTGNLGEVERVVDRGQWESISVRNREGDTHTLIPRSNPGRKEFNSSLNPTEACVISGFRREIDEICALLPYYAAYSGNYLETFRDNLSVLPSRAKDSKNILDPWRWDG